MAVAHRSDWRPENLQVVVDDYATHKRPGDPPRYVHLRQDLIAAIENYIDSGIGTLRAFTRPGTAHEILTKATTGQRSLSTRQIGPLTQYAKALVLPPSAIWYQRVRLSQQHYERGHVDHTPPDAMVSVAKRLRRSVLAPLAMNAS